MLTIRKTDGAIMARTETGAVPILIHPAPGVEHYILHPEYDRSLLCYMEPHVIPHDTKIYPIEPRIVTVEYDNKFAYRPGSVPEWAIIKKMGHKMKIWDGLIVCNDMDHPDGTSHNNLISAIIRGKDMVRLIHPPESVLAIYDSKGEAPLYTIVYKKRDGLRLSWNPDHREGITLDIKNIPDPVPEEYGTEIEWFNLSVRVREYILRRSAM